MHEYHLHHVITARVVIDSQEHFCFGLLSTTMTKTMTMTTTDKGNNGTKGGTQAVLLTEGETDITAVCRAARNHIRAGVTD